MTRTGSLPDFSSEFRQRGLERNELREILSELRCKFPELGLGEEWTRPVSAQFAAETLAMYLLRCLWC